MYINTFLKINENKNFIVVIKCLLALNDQLTCQFDKIKYASSSDSFVVFQPHKHVGFARNSIISIGYSAREVLFWADKLCLVIFLFSVREVQL